MTTLFNPLIDKQNSIATDLSSDIVQGWSLKECMSFCNDQLEKSFNQLSLEDFVEMYERFHNKSIISEIKWTDITSIEIDWSNVCSCICKPSMMDNFGQFYTVSDDDDDVELWIIEISFHNGTHIDLLHSDNEEEAKIIADSIRRFYADDCASSS